MIVVERIGLTKGCVFVMRKKTPENTREMISSSHIGRLLYKTRHG